MAKRFVLVDESEAEEKFATLELGPPYSEVAPEVPIETATGGLTPLRQTCTWKYIVSSSLYGPIFAEVEMRCRFVKQTKIIQDANSNEVVSTAFLRCLHNVKANDHIIYNSVEYPISSVDAITGIGGGIIEYEVRL